MLWSLFAKNPFRALQDLMKQVLVCVNKTELLFAALKAGNQEKVRELAKEISKVEHDCDILKQDLRTQISKSVFLPVDRRDLIHVLSHMDAIADECEDLGVLLTLREMSVPDFAKDSLEELMSSALQTVYKADEVIRSLDRLLETGFAGPDAVEILKKIDEIDHLEHLADKAQDKFGKALFQHEDEIKPAALFMWNKITNKIGDLANSSERMVAHVRLMLSNN